MSIEALIRNIAEQGLLGLLLALSVLTNYMFYKEIQRKDKVIEDLNNARVNDLKDIQSKNSEIYTGIRLTLENILGLLGRKK